MWKATVVEHHRLRQDLAVVRLIGEAVPFAAGQSVSVVVPQQPMLSRRLSPALPPSLDGKLEFHVRTVPGGWVSGSIVNDTKPGDVWTIDEPAGDMAIDDTDRDVVMIAGDTGLAPLRALLLDVSRRPYPPQVYLFYSGRFPRDLYAADMLFLLANELPWLTVIPVVERIDDPTWRDEWYDRLGIDVGFSEDELLEGPIAEVVGWHGSFEDRQVLVCGSPTMVRATLAKLAEGGTPSANVRFDPP